MSLNPSQVPAKLVDGSTETKWIDASFAWLLGRRADPPNPTVVKEYVFYTGANPDKRDSTRWTVERLNHGTWQTWVLRWARRRLAVACPTRHSA